MPDLIDDLFAQIKYRFCYLYLSDLRTLSPAEKHEIGHILCKYPPEKYSLTAWMDALEYLAHIREHAVSPADAKAILINALLTA